MLSTMVSPLLKVCLSSYTFLRSHLRSHQEVFSLQFQQVAPLSHELDLELVGLVGKFLLVEQLLILVVEQLLLLVVEQIPNPILFSIRVSMRSLAEKSR